MSVIGEGGSGGDAGAAPEGEALDSETAVGRPANECYRAGGRLTIVLAVGGRTWTCEDGRSRGLPAIPFQRARVPAIHLI